MTYEAKARGVVRGMRIHEIKRICPDVIILPSDYETYSLFSRRMYEIVRRYTPVVEEYSIDECFADITEVPKVIPLSYENIALKIKKELYAELGITFTVGLAPTKVLAKVASKWKKPDGLTIIPGSTIHRFLEELPVGKIWGIGPATEHYLVARRITTALHFAETSDTWIRTHLSKPFREIRAELRGVMVLPVARGAPPLQQSIMKTQTFTPPSRDPETIFARLSKNIENACIRARRHALASTRIGIFLKTQDFHYAGFELKLPRKTNVPEEILAVIRPRFRALLKSNTLYRATGIVLSDLTLANPEQMGLFPENARSERLRDLYGTIDQLADRFGKHTIFLGATERALNRSAHQGIRGTPSTRASTILPGETARQHIGLPFLGSVS